MNQNCILQSALVHLIPVPFLSHCWPDGCIIFTQEITKLWSTAVILTLDRWFPLVQTLFKHIPRRRNPADTCTSLWRSKELFFFVWIQSLSKNILTSFAINFHITAKYKKKEKFAIYDNTLDFLSGTGKAFGDVF